MPVNDYAGDDNTLQMSKSQWEKLKKKSRRSSDVDLTNPPEDLDKENIPSVDQNFAGLVSRRKNGK